ncbi:MAG TPA: tetratricopeptide repeat protein [bacterium]|jgi:hypothetical protein|nr:tetratricopeptide repeat protein [bacterium]
MSREGRLVRAFCSGLAGLGFLLLPAGAAATGPYMFGTFGARVVSNQDMNDFFAMGSQNAAEFIPSEVGEAYLTAGYRFTDPFALELSSGAQQGREESNLYSFGDVDLQVPSGALSLVSIAPVFCFDTFTSSTSSWLNQVGFRLEYAQVSGVETLESTNGSLSSLNFNGQTLGGSLFYRLVNLWPPARLSVGLEAGYEYLRFNQLESGNPSGVFVGQPGRTLQNMNGAQAFLDNSGFYVRLVVGWDKDSIFNKGAGARVASKDVVREASADALLARARNASKQGDSHTALRCYREYLRVRPTDAAAWTELGRVYESFGRKDFAQECFEQAKKAR